MNISILPSSAFIHPRGDNYSEVEEFADRILRLVLSHASTAAERSPLPDLEADMVLSKIPEAPVAESEILDGLKKLLETSMNAAHPGYMGYMNSMPTTASILGDLAAAAIDNNMLSLELSPSISRLEHHLTKQIASYFGFNERAAGVFVGGGSVANLQAVAIARNVSFDSLEKGIVGSSEPPVLLASHVAHTSVQKAAMILGLGTSAVIPVAVDERSRMDVGDLEEKIEELKLSGQRPFCVVATAGTTVSGSIDPLVEIYEVASKHNLWLHVDAAYGGALVFSGDQKARLSGIDLANSVTFDPHKWLYIARNCAMLLLRDGQNFEEYFRIPVPYMSFAGDITNIGEISIHGTNHADVLKLWISLQHLGRVGYAHLIDESYRLTKVLVEEIERRSFIELLNAPEMNIVCFRCKPEWLREDQWDEWNVALQSHLFRECGIHLSIPPYRGNRWLRANLLNPYIDDEPIERIFTEIDRFMTEKRGE